MSSTNQTDITPTHCSSIDLDTVRSRVSQALADAYMTGNFTLIEALPVSGKSYASIQVAAKTDTPILYLTSRTDLKDQALDWCEQFDLDAYSLPVPHSDCPSFRGDHGDSLADELKKVYDQGVSGAEVHSRRDLPCQDGQPCSYMKRREFRPADYDVLVGNPRHAYNEQFLQNRVVVKDEFSEDEFEFEFKNVEHIINEFLERTQLPFNSYHDILHERENYSDNVEEAIAWFQEYGLYQDASGVLATMRHHYHVLAPTLTFALLYGHLHELDNGWERVQVGDMTKVKNIDAKTVSSDCLCVRNSTTDRMYLLNPPAFEMANGFVGLDGTPTPKIWQIATGTNLSHQEVLKDTEKQKYITDVLNHTIIQTNDDLKPYQNPRNVTPCRDTELAYWIRLKEGEAPGVITSRQAIETVYPDYNDGEFFRYVDACRNFAKVLSYNGFEDKHLGFVSGSRHYGDPYIKKWGAYAGEAVTTNGKRGPAKSYGKFGDTIHQHLKHQTLQDVLRFGRNTNPTTVYVNTSALPEWVPTHPEKYRFLVTETARQVVPHLKEQGAKGVSARELAQVTGLNKETARRKLTKFVEKDIVERHELPNHNDPTLYVWTGIE